MRRTLFTLHRWCGLALGVFLAVQGLLGAFLVIHEPLDRWLHPQLVTSAERGGAETITAARAYESVRRAHPERAVWFLRTPPSPGDAYRIVLDGPAGPRVFVDAATGRINGSRPASSIFEDGVRDIHTGVLGGPVMESLIGILAIALLVLTVTGIVVWWPGLRRLRRALRFSLASLAAAARDGHRWAGLLALPVLILIAASGIYLIFHHAVEDTVNAITGERSFPPELEVTRTDARWTARDVAGALRAARGAVPGAEVSFLSLPADRAEPAQVRLHLPGEWHPLGNSAVLLDRAGGEVLAVYDAREAGAGHHALDRLYPLHIGRYAGSASRALHVVAGLLPTGFVITGLYLWWRRRRAGAR